MLSHLGKSKGDPYYEFSKFESFGKSKGDPDYEFSELTRLEKCKGGYLYLFCWTMSKIVRVPPCVLSYKFLLNLDTWKN